MIRRAHAEVIISDSARGGHVEDLDRVHLQLVCFETDSLSTGSCRSRLRVQLRAHRPDNGQGERRPTTALRLAAYTGTTGAGPRRSALITLWSSLSVPCTSPGGVSAIQRLSETSA